MNDRIMLQLKLLYDNAVEDFNRYEDENKTTDDYLEGFMLGIKNAIDLIKYEMGEKNEHMGRNKKFT